jgi:hypothetical protein
MNSLSSAFTNITESPAAAFARHFYYTSNFTWEYLTFNYHDYRYVYCTDDVTIPGEQNFFIGGFYICLYLFFLLLYIPSLIVISRPPLINHAAYKLMLAVGLMDNVVGFFFTFLAGVYTCIGEKKVLIRDMWTSLPIPIIQGRTTVTTPTFSSLMAISPTASTSSTAR